MSQFCIKIHFRLSKYEKRLLLDVLRSVLSWCPLLHPTHDGICKKGLSLLLNYVRYVTLLTDIPKYLSD